jgi:adenylate cyclase
MVAAPDADSILQDYMQSGQLPQMAEQTVTVLVSDICNSTRLAERVGAKRFGEILAHYYHDMTEIVFDHGGLLNKYLGDGLLATFGVTQKRPDPEERAVRTALAMLGQLEAITDAVGEPIEMGLGLNTGPAVAGYVRGEERLEYTVLGDAVNVAFGLEALARPNRIFVGPATYQAVSQSFKTQSVGPVELKKRTKPIGAYEILRE